MRDEDDALAGIDLTAWEPPAPPASLVDGVIARAKESAVPALVEPPAPRAVKAAPHRAPTRWWIAGGVAASVAAVAAFGAWGLERAKPTSNGAVVATRTSGEVVATQARTLALGASSAKLDPGARVTWRREGARLVIAQHEGGAVWQVDRGDTLVIDAGAKVASVEASGASLRVEVTMLDRTDVKIATGTTAIAATVALVTVLVYEGTAKVAHDGHTVNVVAGERYEVDPQVTPDDQYTVGSPPYDFEARKREIEEFERQNKLLEQEMRELREPKRTLPASTCDEVSCILNNYEGACCTKYKPKRADANPPDPNLPEALDRSMISTAMAAIKPQIEACEGSFKGTVKLSVTVAPSGEVTRTRVKGPDGDDRPADLAACMHAASLNLTFPRTQHGGSFSYPYRFDGTGKQAAPPAPAPSAPSACNVEFLLEKGNGLANHAMWSKALEKFDEAMRCKPTEATAKRAFAAACHAKDIAKAKAYYTKLPVDAQSQLLPLCKRNGLDPSVGACDAVAPREKAEALLQEGKDAAALYMFQQSLGCKQDNVVRRLAFMAACRAKDVTSATQLFSEMVNAPASMVQICGRNGIALPATGSLVVTTTPDNATVELDGAVVGTSPMTLTIVAGKQRQLTLRKDSHRHTISVRTTPNGSTSLDIDLR